MRAFLPTFFAAIILAFGLTCEAQAKVVENGYFGCLDEASLDEFIAAAIRKDTRQLEALLRTACVPIGGREFSMVDRGLLRSTIRIYVGDGSVILWVPAEAAY